MFRNQPLRINFGSKKNRPN